jgi:hypothetical protein
VTAEAFHKISHSTIQKCQDHYKKESRRNRLKKSQIQEKHMQKAAVKLTFQRRSRPQVSGYNLCKWVFLKVKQYRKAHNEKRMIISLHGKIALDEIQQPFLI